MTEHKPQGARHSRGDSGTGHRDDIVTIRAGETLSPYGKLMSFEDLPPKGTQRWVIRRKAEVVAGVHGGLISLEQACRRYDLSVDEFRSWEALLKNHGLPGLRTTRAKKYRCIKRR